MCPHSLPGQGARARQVPSLTLSAGTLPLSVRTGSSRKFHQQVGVLLFHVLKTVYALTHLLFTKFQLGGYFNVAPTLQMSKLCQRKANLLKGTRPASWVWNKIHHSLSLQAHIV